jgi:hypothetical protein
MTWSTVAQKYDQQRKEEQRARDAAGRFAPATNPFVKDARGHRNLTAIHRLLRTNPALGKRLCQEAGEVWESWADTRPHIQSDLGRDLSLGHRS